MFTSTEGIEWPRVLFVGWFVLTCLGVLAAWIRGRLRGDASESPAEVPAIMSDTEAIAYPGSKIVLVPLIVEPFTTAPQIENSQISDQSDYHQDSILIEKSLCEELMTEPQYSSLPGNTFHQFDD